MRSNTWSIPPARYCPWQIVRFFVQFEILGSLVDDLHFERPGSGLRGKFLGELARLGFVEGDFQRGCRAGLLGRRTGAIRLQINDPAVAQPPLAFLGEASIFEILGKDRPVLSKLAPIALDDPPTTTT